MIMNEKELRDLCLKQEEAINNDDTKNCLYFLSF